MNAIDEAASAAPTAEPTKPAMPTKPAKQQTLGEALRFFMGKTTPKVFLPAVVLLAVWRVRQGGFSWWDLAVVVGILAVEPFTEWAIHVYVLHFRPRTVGGRRLDLHAAKKHREHHGDPNDPNTAFVPLVDLLMLGPIILALYWLIMRGDTGLVLTAALVSMAMLTLYEWTHFLIHTAYKPKGRYYRYIWRAHRLHHFKNEHYWMGVTVHLADHVLGTFPAKSEVQNSPTARTLGIDVVA